MVLNCAVVILNYKNIEGTISCIEEFNNQGENVKIVVVDNNSQDGSHEVLSKTENIVYLQTNSNIGYARGNNFGIDYILKNFHVDFIVISNNDIKLKNKFIIKKISSVILRLPNNWGFLGTKILNSDGTVWQEKPLKHTTFLERIVNSTLFGIPFRRYYKDLNIITIEEEDFYESNLVSGAFFILNPEAIKLIGAFDPYTFLYGEERIIAKKYYNSGFKGYITRDVEVIHENSTTTKKYPVISYINSLKSEYYYFLKYCNLSRVKCEFLVLLRLADTIFRIIIGSVPVNVLGETIEMYKITRKELK